MTPLSLVEELLSQFKAADPREDKFAKALREQLATRKFDGNGKLVGPSLNLASIARHARLPLKLVSFKDCALPGARKLLLDAMERLSEFSLQVERDYLREEVKRLKARVDSQDSILANRVVLLHKKKTEIEPTSPTRYTAEDVLNAAQIRPMDEI